MPATHLPDDGAGVPAPPGCKLLSPGAGDTLHVLFDAATFKVLPDDTGGRFSIVEVATGSGSGVPTHVHADDDEAIYVLEGAYLVRIGAATRELGPGATAFVRRGTPHGYANVGTAPARLLVISSPATPPVRQFTELASALTEGVDGTDELREAFRALAQLRGVGLE